MPTTSPPGTYRTATEAPVDFAHARAAWVRSARPILTAVAQRYHETISYKELADKVQSETGIRTRKLMANWIGEVLAEISAENRAEGEPLLASLVLRADGTIGPGFAACVEAQRGEQPEDIDLYGGEEREKCYRHFGAKIPANGGTPLFKRSAPTNRAPRASRATKVLPPPPATCPKCHLILPFTGRCNNCGRGEG